MFKSVETNTENKENNMTEPITEIDGLEKRLDNLEANMNRKLDHILKATARPSVILEDLVKVSRPMICLLPRTDFTFVAMKSEENRRIWKNY